MLLPLDNDCTSHTAPLSPLSQTSKFRPALPADGGGDDNLVSSIEGAIKYMIQELSQSPHHVSSRVVHSQCSLK